MNDNAQHKRELLKIISTARINKQVINGLEMSGLDFAFSDLSEVMGDCIIAKGVNLRASSLIRASFLDCDFESTDFRNSNLEKIEMGDCILNGANLNKTILKGAKINISMCRETCFDEADISEGEVIGSSFSNSSFKNANLSRINAQQASFSNADLTGAILTEGGFEETDFRNAILDGVVWIGARIDGAMFDEGVMEIVKSKL